ncbi:MAG: HDOD domain-containing protein [Phycisphaerales bacterium]
MKPRSSLSAAEVTSLLEYLERRLDSAGVATQPEVAVRLVNLTADPDAAMRDYADTVRSDVSLAGRLLRMANSAYFAQRQPVTTIERACVLLGVERLKAVSLGFCLSRSATGGTTRGLSRRIWGESLLRACLVSELARAVDPAHVSEAFVIGLMLDAGVPLLADWLGPPADRVLEAEPSPAAQYQAEFRTLPYTHVDVVAAMAQRWKLPELLAKPIARHHSEPSARPVREPVHQLHRLAYCIGNLRLDEGAADPLEQPLAPPAVKLLGVGAEAVKEAVGRAVAEHAAMMVVFRDIAWLAGDIGAIAERAQRQLVEVMDQTMIAQLRRETRTAPESFTVAGHRVEIECPAAGQALAYLTDARGRRLLSHAFSPAQTDAGAVLEALGLHDPQDALSRELDTYIRSLAA